MLAVSLIILASGDSTRFELPCSKLFLRLGNLPLWLYSAKNLSSFYPFKKIIIACKDPQYFQSFEPNYHYVLGGDSRGASLKNALLEVDSKYVLVSDAARPIIEHELLKKLFENASKAHCITPVLKVADSIIYDNSFANKEKLKLIYTPQLSNTKLLKDALKKDESFTDDSAAIASMGGKIWYVNANTKAKKLTYLSDLKELDLPALKQEFFVGSGFDIHSFGANRPLILGGVEIDPNKGLIAHSDGDVLSHALIDALLGAALLGDIGELFPDDDDSFKDISSLILLENAYKKVLKYGFELVNADICILAQNPKISPFKKEIATKLGKILNCRKINIKATTTERLGFIGREEGVAVMASVSLKYFDWMKI